MKLQVFSFFWSEGTVVSATNAKGTLDGINDLPHRRRRDVEGKAFAVANNALDEFEVFSRIAASARQVNEPVWSTMAFRRYSWRIEVAKRSKYFIFWDSEVTPQLPIFPGSDHAHDGIEDIEG